MVVKGSIKSVARLLETRGFSTIAPFNLFNSREINLNLVLFCPWPIRIPWDRVSISFFDIMAISIGSFSFFLNKRIMIFEISIFFYISFLLWINYIIIFRILIMSHGNCIFILFHFIVYYLERERRNFIFISCSKYFS